MFDSFRSIETNKTKFSAEFSDNCSEMFEKVSSLVNNFMKYFNSSYVPFGEIKPYGYK